MPDENDHAEIGSTESDSEIDTAEGPCNCDPDYKETAVIQESMGMNLGLFGGQVGIGDTVVICKNCHKMYAVEDTRRSDAENY